MMVTMVMKLIALMITVICDNDIGNDEDDDSNQCNDYDDDLSSLSALLRDPLLSSPDDRAPSLLNVLTW